MYGRLPCGKIKKKGQASSVFIIFVWDSKDGPVESGRLLINRSERARIVKVQQEVGVPRCSCMLIRGGHGSGG